MPLIRAYFATVAAIGLTDFADRGARAERLFIPSSWRLDPILFDSLGIGCVNFEIRGQCPEGRIQLAIA
jgi:hypothetical protein